MRRILITALSITLGFAVQARADDVYPFERAFVADHISEGVWVVSQLGDHRYDAANNPVQVLVSNGQFTIEMPCGVAVLPAGPARPATNDQDRIAVQPCIAIHTIAIDVASILTAATAFTVSRDGAATFQSDRGMVVIVPAPVMSD